MTQQTLPDSDDAQRSLERKALRNVRSLVDKLEQEQAPRGANTMRFIVACVAVSLAVAVGGYFVVAGGKTRQAPIVSPAKTAPTSPAR